MFDMSVRGGAPQVILDTINTLNSMGEKVYLLTPFRLDYQKIEECHKNAKIEKVYYPNNFKSLFCKGNFLPRRFMKKEFQQMIKEVDLIIDIDGGVIHKYLPKDFDKYIVWRFSCIYPDLTLKWSFKRKIKEKMKVLLGSRRCIPSKDYKVYAHDEWTKRELLKHWNLQAQERCLYAGVKTEEFTEENAKKKNQNKKRDENFFNKIKEFLEKKGIEILDIKDFRNDEAVLKIKRDRKEELLFVFNKKKITEKEILKSHKKASEENLKFSILFLSEAPKKLNDLIEAVKNLSEIDRIT